MDTFCVVSIILGILISTFAIVTKNMAFLGGGCWILGCCFTRLWYSGEIHRGREHTGVYKG